MILPVAILAGGLATRLGAITETIPKALIEVAGEPFVVHQLALLRAAGARRVVLCVAHLADQIEAVLGDGSAFGLDVVYSHDALVGTGGALRQALPLLGEEFFVVYGDSYLRCDYAAIASAWLAQRQARPDDGVRERGPLGREQCRVRRPDPALRQDARRDRDLTHID